MKLPKEKHVLSFYLNSRKDLTTSTISLNDDGLVIKEFAPSL